MQRVQCFTVFVGSDVESVSDSIVMVADTHPSRVSLPMVATPSVASESDEDGLVVSPGPSERDRASQVDCAVLSVC